MLLAEDSQPENVLVGSDGRPRVADFGLARGLDVLGEEPRAPSPPPVASGQALLQSPLTQAGTLLGTPAYMSPEQLRGEAADSRSDQFSFCAALYAALYKATPFAGDTLAALSASVLAGQLRPVPADSPVPARIAEALRKGLAVDRDKRFPQMTALLSALALDLARDPAGAQAARRLFVRLLLTMMGVCTALIYLLGAHRWLSLPVLIGAELVVLGALLGVSFLMRRSLMQNAFHRGMVKLLVVVLFELLGVRIIGMRLGLGVPQVLSLEIISIAGLFSVIAIQYLPGCWAISGACAAISLAMTYYPDALMPWVSSFYMALTLVVAFLWNRASDGIARGPGRILR